MDLSSFTLSSRELLSSMVVSRFQGFLFGVGTNSAMLLGDYDDNSSRRYFGLSVLFGVLSHILSFYELSGHVQIVHCAVVPFVARTRMPSVAEINTRSSGNEVRALTQQSGWPVI